MSCKIPLSGDISALFNAQSELIRIKDYSLLWAYVAGLNKVYSAPEFLLQVRAVQNLSINEQEARSAVTTCGYLLQKPKIKPAVLRSEDKKTVMVIQTKSKKPKAVSIAIQDSRLEIIKKVPRLQPPSVKKHKTLKGIRRVSPFGRKNGVSSIYSVGRLFRGFALFSGGYR